MLFRVALIVDAKKLPKALVALDGLGYDLQVQTVKNAEPVHGKLRETGEPTTGTDVVKAYLRQHLDTVGAHITTKKLLEEAGVSKPIVAATLKALVKSRALNRTSRGQYTINPHNL